MCLIVNPALHLLLQKLERKKKGFYVIWLTNGSLFNNLKIGYKKCSIMLKLWCVLIFTFFYIKRIQNYRFPVFDGFTRFGMSWTRFDYFWKMSVCLCVCLCVCVRQKFCGNYVSKTNAQNFIKFCIKCYPSLN